MGNRAESIKFFNQAVSSLKDEKNPNRQSLAYGLFSSAVVADPTFWQAHYQAGCNNHDLKKFDAAVANCRLALQCKTTDEERAKVLVNLGWCMCQLGRTSEAIEHTKAALAINPNDHLPWLNLSIISQQVRDKRASLAAASRAYALAPKDITVQIAKAFGHLFNADWAEGLKFFEARFEWRLQNFLQFPYKKWTGEEGKTLFLVADQGLGDTLSYSRFVEAASKRCKYMHLYIQPPLMRLFHLAFAHLRNVNLIPQPQPFPEADYWTTFVSLPFALGLTNAEIEQAPHINVPAIQHPMRGAWRVTDRKFHVGIAWRGSPLNDINVHRNIPIENFFELCKVTGVQLYSLQADKHNQELHDAGGAALVRDLTPGISDVVDTMGLLRDLDLVVCCESFLGHAAALAGKECIIPYSYRGRDYRAGLSGEHKLWTPAHTFVLQEQRETWEPAFERVMDMLREKVGAREAA